MQVNPADDATGVFVGASVAVRFNTCLDPATVTTASFVLVAGTSFVPRAVSYDPATATVTVDPAGNLAYSTLHLFSVSGVRGAHGETMTVFGSVFTTQAAPEFVPPTTSASPAGGRYNTPQSVSLTCADNPGGTGCAATYYTMNGTTPTPASTRYTVPIAIAADTTLRFFSVDGQGNAEVPRQEVYVIDTVPPALVGSDPPNGATGVPVNAVLAATFSEEMKASTLGPATATVDNGVAVTVSYSAGPPSQATIAPVERLACGTTYHVSISAGATDVAGNALVQPATFSFTTAADCQEPSTTATPAGGVYLAAQAVTLTCDDGAGSGCARIVYTTDGSVPSLEPPHGTIVSGASTGPISIGPGDTELRYFAEDVAGNREALRQQAYSVSVGQGFTFVATDDGIARGVGAAPATFVPLRRGGRTAVFHRDPSNGRLYRGTERGLMVSDGGEAFSFLAGAPSSVISVLAQGAKIFAGTSGGLYVSLDGGGTFAQRDVGSTSAWVRSIVASGYRVWAATDGGVAVSADKGWSFELKTAADGLGSNSVRALVLDGGTLYAATAGGLSISTDLGATFTNYVSGLPSVSVNDIAVSGNSVYAATDAGLAISTDGGLTFPTVRTMAHGLGSNYVGKIVFDGTKLYAETGEPWLSGASNSFSISTDATGASFQPHAVSPSHPTLRTDSIHVEGSTVRVGAYPAYYLSTDGGVSFTPKDLRGSVRKITGLGSTLYAAVSDGSGYGGLAISTDRGQSFTIRDRSSGIPSDNVDDVAAAFAGGLTYVYAATFSGLGISSDGGATFTPTTVNPGAGNNVDCVWASGATVWACAGSTLNLSTNSGGTFAQRLASVNSPNAVAVFGPNVHLSSTIGLWVSGNGGTDWTQKRVADGLANDYLYDVAVDGTGRVLVATNGGLSRSIDSGASFTAAASPQIYAYGVHAQGSVWYAAGSSGLSMSQDGGATWVPRGPAQGVVATARDAWYMP
ncbi:MAG TPA: chitobiase/beta-hexosaminidase C-terminal domain-containing protein [Anaeromyxobacteraceae bacterium]|nr:chitobiase/beta-hexosaminidase C-terminal domain-containing protein [Anaeromyxobacteraceae bacterium]